VGEHNHQWEGTPLIVVYEHFRAANTNKSKSYAEKQAAKAIGHMLKRVIVDDKRTFDTRIIARVRHYKWTGAENNTKTPNWQRVAVKWYQNLRQMVEC
ncbi:MAG: hypothetical protein J6M55_02230, partial [Paludibacteraceae bacterium]|nr:hypothetical protein [Paludibacteraceae bacterium]